MTAKVLIVEDDPVLGAGLKAGLEKAGHAVVVAIGIDQARSVMDETPPIALLLDLSLPDGDGMGLLRDLRRRDQRLPVMIVTAAGQRETRLLGLDSGADDYVVKPYDLDEVVARLRGLLRRARGVAGDVLPVGGYELDLRGQVVRQGEKTLLLTQREFRVLSTLAARAGRWVSKPDIEYIVYEDAADIESNTIEAAVYGLRKKLGNEIILTARGLGYMVPR